MKRTLLLLVVLALLPALGAVGQAKMTVNFASYLYYPSDEDSYALKYVEAKFPDVDWKPIGIMQVGNSYYEQLNVKVAGGDVPDVIFQIDNARMSLLVAQGVMMEVPYDLIRQNMPKSWKVIQKFGPEVLIASYYQGKNWGIPLVNESQTFPFTDGIRLDWLKKVGLKLPATVQDLDAIFRAFTKNDPDGNGKNDTYAFTMRGKDSPENMFPQLYGAYKAWSDQWMVNVDGSISYGTASGNFKEVLRWLNKWYTAGYLDPEFITADNNAVKERWNNGQIGYAPMTTWYRLMPTGEYYDQLMTLNPKAEIGLVPAVKGPTGSYGYMGWGKNTGNYGFGKHMEQKLDVVKRVMQIFDEFNTDPALYANMKFGQEGVHWKRDDKTGQAVYIPPYNDPQQRAGIGNAFWGKFGNWDMQMLFDWPKNVAELTKYATDRTFVPEKSFTMLVLLSADTNKIKTAVRDAARPWIIKFITGEKSIDRDWVNFQADLKKAGLDRVTKEANDYYKDIRKILAGFKAELDK